VELRHSIFKRGKKGGGFAKNYSNKWVLRFVWRDEKGKIREKSYYFRTEQDAKDARPRLEAALAKTGGRSTVGDKMTFGDLAEEAKRTYYAPAEFSGGRKISGIKSHRQTWILIDSLIDYIGNKALANMTRSDMDGYKSWRLKQGDRRGLQGKLKPKDRKPVSLSTVNRSLAILKRMLKHAHAEGWISRDITRGSKAIDPDAEKARTRTLTASEESFLLASCQGERTVTYQRKGKAITVPVSAENSYLKTIILFGLDAGLRRNEILTLDWSDIDFKQNLIEVQSQHTKTQRGRNIPLTKRLKQELLSLPVEERTGEIFPFKDFKRSWKTALKIAGIEGLTFHDLRRTFVTRLSAKGVPLALAGKIAGHSSLSTTQKHYVSTEDLAILEDVRNRLEESNNPADLDSELSM